MTDNPIINLDWVAFSISLIPNPNEKDAHAFSLNPIDQYGFHVVEFTGTNIYKRRAIVYDADGQKLLTLLFEPLSRIIDYNSCLVEVANPLLYRRNVRVCGVAYYALQWVPELLQLIHPCTMQCLSRIDIAADFPLTPARAQIVRQLSYDEVYVQRYRDGVSFHEFEAFRGAKVARVTKQLSWGSKKSNIKWKLYNKSLEVFEYDKTPNGYVRQCNKPYIVAQWMQEGWNVENVWRLECSITPMEKYRFQDRRLYFKDLSNAFIINELYTILYQTKFVTRINQGHEDRSNDTRVFLLGNLGECTKLGIREPKDSKEVQEYVNGLRAAMAQLTKTEVIINEPMRQLWIDTAMRCTSIGHLEGYFWDTYGYPVTQLPAKDLLINPPITGA